MFVDHVLLQMYLHDCCFGLNKRIVTTGKQLVCREPHVCRVLNHGHTAKIVFAMFAVCPETSSPHIAGTRQKGSSPCVVNSDARQTQAHGKWAVFAVCPDSGTRQILHPVTQQLCRFVCRVPTQGTRQTKTYVVCFCILPCVHLLAHGKLFNKKWILPS